MPRKKLETAAPEAVLAPAAKKTVRKRTPAAIPAAAEKPKRAARTKAETAAVTQTPEPVANVPAALAGEAAAIDATEQITRLAHGIYQARQRRGEGWGTPEGDWAYAEVLYREGVTNLE